MKQDNTIEKKLSKEGKGYTSRSPIYLSPYGKRKLDNIQEEVNKKCKEKHSKSIPYSNIIEFALSLIKPDHHNEIINTGIKKSEKELVDIRWKLYPDLSDEDFAKLVLETMKQKATEAN